MIKDIFPYLEELSVNNNREWFATRKPQFDVLRQDFSHFIDQLIDRISRFDEEIAGVSSKDCIYRIYRDTRFSPDKTPYKDYFSAYIVKGGRKSWRSGYYIHLQPGGKSMVSGGVWSPESKLLKNLRQAVYDNYEELLEIINNAEFKKYYPRFEGESLKTVPRNFPKEFEYADLLKRKDYVVVNQVPDTLFQQSDFEEEIVYRCKLLQPLHRFLNYTVDETLE